MKSIAISCKMLKGNGVKETENDIRKWAFLYKKDGSSIMIDNSYTDVTFAMRRRKLFDNTMIKDDLRPKKIPENIGIVLVMSKRTWGTRLQYSSRQK